MKPAVLRAFPAARLIRDMGVKEPRPRHQANLGEVRLKTDPRWADFHNAKDIGGFGVPWGPYGFNSGVTQEDVSKAEAGKLGLKLPDASPPVPGLNDGLESSTRKMDPETKRKLLEELRRGPKSRDPKEAAREAAAKVRREALSRGLSDADKRGDSTKAAKYRKAIAELPDTGLQVREEGDKIVLENGRESVTIPPLPDESQRDRIPEAQARKLPETDQDRTLAEARDDIRRILSADGTIHGNEDDPDFILRQFAGLENGAIKERFILKNLTPDARGGVEHDVIFDTITGTVLKFTKPNKAAYAVDFELGTPRMAPALPLDYLERLELQNEIFEDNLRFVGLASNNDGERIVTRQDIVKGRPASWEEITRLMVDDLGFTKLRHNHGIGYDDSYAFVRDDSVVFDMRPANVFVTADGSIVPIDCIPVRLPAGKRAFFDK